MANDQLRNLREVKYLSNFAVAYKSGQYIADFVAPPVTVVDESGKYPIYGKENWRVFDTKLGRMEETKKINVEASDGTYACEEYGLGTAITDKDKRNTPNPIRLEEAEIANLKDAFMRSREKRVIDIAVANCSAGSADKNSAWSTPSSATPTADIQTGIIAVKNGCGKKANAIAMTDEVAMAMIKSAEWKDYFKYTWGNTNDGNGLFSVIDGLRHFGLTPMISGAEGLSTPQGGASDPTSENLLSDKVLIFYREPVMTLRSMTFMSSPNQYQNRVVSWYEEKKRATFYDIMESIDELLVCAYAGYLIDDVL